MDFRIKVTEKDVLSFHLYHSYHKVQTWLFTILGVVITLLSFTTYGEIDVMYTMLYFMCGLVFVFYTPLSLRSNAKRSVRGNGPLSMAVEYRFSEEGVEVSYVDAESQEEEENSGSVTWEQVFKIVETKKAFYLYTSPRSASILPKDQLQGNVEKLQSLFRKELEPFKYGR